MIEKEITQAKQCALTTRDWDTYQVIVRTCLTPDKSPLYQLVAGQQAVFYPAPDMKNEILKEKRG